MRHWLQRDADSPARANGYLFSRTVTRCFPLFDRFCHLYRRIRAAEEKSADFYDPLAGINDRGMNLRLG